MRSLFRDQRRLKHDRKYRLWATVVDSEGLTKDSDSRSVSN